MDYGEESDALLGRRGVKRIGGQEPTSLADGGHCNPKSSKTAYFGISVLDLAVIETSGCETVFWRNLSSF